MKRLLLPACAPALPLLAVRLSTQEEDFEFRSSAIDARLVDLEEQEAPSAAARAAVAKATGMDAASLAGARLFAARTRTRIGKRHAITACLLPLGSPNSAPTR